MNKKELKKDVFSKLSWNKLYELIFGGVIKNFDEKSDRKTRKLSIKKISTIYDDKKRNTLQ